MAQATAGTMANQPAWLIGTPGWWQNGVEAGDTIRWREEQIGHRIEGAGEWDGGGRRDSVGRGVG